MTDTPDGSDDYKVGYGNPPREHQFKAGHRRHRRRRASAEKNYASRRDAMLDAPVGQDSKLDTAGASFMVTRELALKHRDYRANLRIQELDRERYEEELAAKALSERRSFEEHELTLLMEALPRLNAKLGGTQ